LAETIDASSVVEGSMGENLTTEGSEDSELVARALRNDPWAIDRLIRRYHQRVFGIAYRMCAGNVEEAKDAVQEAFVRVIRNLKKFKGQSTFYTWLYRIVVNTCLDARRKAGRRKLFGSWWGSNRTGRGSFEQKALLDFPDETWHVDPMETLKGRQFRADIQKALKDLSDRQRSVFELKVFEGLSISEIASALHTSEGTVKSHLFRATRHLREALKDWVD